MTASARWQAIQSLFEQALAQPQAARDAWLQAQDVDEALRTEVSEMLAAHSGPPLLAEASTLGATTVNEAIPAQIGPYRILTRLGRGGMGDVYLGERADGRFDRKVAIKLAAQRLSYPQLQERFEREQRIHAQLDHPHIARLLDAGVAESGQPYLVMEYVDGVEITDHIDTHRSSLRNIVELVAQTCAAVSFAHGRLVLHRDLKPSNILVDQDGQARLLDFGIAKMLDEDTEFEADSQLTEAGERPMTLAYASPEQIESNELSATSDVFSLGVVLFELMTGRRPFNGSSQHALGRQIVEKELNPGDFGGQQKIPADLQAICLKALEKRPADRYPSAAALGNDLQAWLEHRVVSARRPGPLARLAKLYRRHPAAVPLATMALVAVIAGGLLAGWQAHVAAQERDVARAERDRAEAVSAVLIDLFDTDPYAETEDRRDDLTLREFLSSRGSQIDSEFEDQPLLQARLLNLLANMFVNLSSLEEAESYAEKALQIRREQLPEDHLDIAESLNVLGNLRANQMRVAESVELLREALAIREAQMPETDPRLAESINNLSTALYYAEDASTMDEQIALDQRALAIRQANFGPRSTQVAESLNGLATMLYARQQGDDLTQAEALFRDALALRSELLGAQHPATANTMSSLANLLHDVGRLDEAEEMFVAAFEASRAALGEQHPRVALALYGHGHLLIEQARWQEAIDKFTASLAISRANYPDDHPWIADDLRQLGIANIGAGDPEQAIPMLRDAISSYRANDQTADALAATNYLAQALIDTDQTGAARELLLAAKAQLDRGNGDEQALARNVELLNQLPTD